MRRRELKCDEVLVSIVNRQVTAKQPKLSLAATTKIWESLYRVHNYRETLCEWKERHKSTFHKNINCESFQYFQVRETNEVGTDLLIWWTAEITLIKIQD